MCLQSLPPTETRLSGSRSGSHVNNFIHLDHPKEYHETTNSIEQSGYNGKIGNQFGPITEQYMTSSMLKPTLLVSLLLQSSTNVFGLAYTWIEGTKVRSCIYLSFPYSALYPLTSATTISFLPLSCRSHGNTIRTWTPSTQIIRHTTRSDLDAGIASDNLAIVFRENVRNQQVAAYAGYVEVRQARAEDVVAAMEAAIVGITEANGSG